MFDFAPGWSVVVVLGSLTLAVVVVVTAICVWLADRNR
jgi:hypothetical protein